MVGVRCSLTVLGGTVEAVWWGGVLWAVEIGHEGTVLTICLWQGHGPVRGGRH